LVLPVALASILISKGRNTMPFSLKTVTLEEFKRAVLIVQEAVEQTSPEDEEAFPTVAMRDVPLISSVALEMAKLDMLKAGQQDEEDERAAKLFATSSVQRAIMALYLIELARQDDDLGAGNGRGLS
jgi:hypothetical protein